jgi:hypothetical protein
MSIVDAFRSAPSAMERRAPAAVHDPSNSRHSADAVVGGSAFRSQPDTTTDVAATLKSNRRK